MLRFVLTIIALSAWTAAAEKITPLEAVAYLTGPSGSPVKGNVTFIQNACGEMVHIRIYLTGLTPGQHGFHVHEKGDQTNGCASMGGHYNPDKVDHGAPDSEVRHVGDLGNVVANEDGIVDTTISDRVLTLTGKRTILGRGLVLHELADDLGLGTSPDSKKTGNAGGRIACGVIGVKSDLDEIPCIPDGASTRHISMSLLVFIVALVLQRSIF